MGSFTVGCLIKNHANREKTVRIPRLMVDTGSEATWIPRKFLAEIEVKPEKRLAFQLANGQLVYRDVGYAVIRVNDSETVDEVVFAEQGDSVLLGPRTLTGLMLWVVAGGERLIAIKSHPAARVVGVQEAKPKTRLNASVFGGRARTPCAPRRAAECPPYLPSNTSLTHYKAPEEIMMAT
jgi:predicted aspartyl protease